MAAPAFARLCAAAAAFVLPAALTPTCPACPNKTKVPRVYTVVGGITQIVGGSIAGVSLHYFRASVKYITPCDSEYPGYLRLSSLIQTRYSEQCPTNLSDGISFNRGPDISLLTLAGRAREPGALHPGRDAGRRRRGATRREESTG